MEQEVEMVLTGREERSGLRKQHLDLTTALEAYKPA